MVGEGWEGGGLLEELAAVGVEGREVEVVCVGAARVERVGELHGRVAEVGVWPVRVIEQEVLHVLGAEGVGGRAAEQNGPLRFGAELEVREDEGLVRVDVVVVFGGERLAVGRVVFGGDDGSTYRCGTGCRSVGR